MKDHVIVCGLGHIGFRTFELFQQLGIKTAVITDKTSEEWRKRVESSGGTFFLGDARNDELLKKAGIHEASAILAVTDQDLVNVSVVMDARRLNPNIRIVCRLFDTNLGKHISDAVGVSQIFSTSELAAPAFVGSFAEEGAVARLNFLEHQATLTESDLNSAQPIISLGKNGEQQGLRSSGESDQSSSNHKLSIKIKKPNEAETSNLEAITRWIFRPSLIRFHRIVSLIAAVILGSAVVVKYQMALSWVDSFYFVTTTVTTVGYGDFNFSTATVEMKIFGILLMLIGATSLAILFSTVAETLLSERLSSLFGGRTVPKRNHVIIVGADNIGLRIAEQLISDGTSLVVIENDRVGRFPADVKRKVAVVEGDARNEETLRQANAASAKAILVVSDDDVWNLSVGLSAQNLNSKIKTIVRVFDADLGEKLQAKLSVTRILSVSSIAAPHFVGAALMDKVAVAVKWRDHLVVLSEKSGQMKDLGTIEIPGVEKPLYVGAARLHQVQAKPNSEIG